MPGSGFCGDYQNLAGIFGILVAVFQIKFLCKPENIS